MVLKRNRQLWFLGLIASGMLAVTSGCKGMGGRNKVTRAEPSLSGVVDDGPVVVAPEATPARTISYVDRHPLFSKPRDYWESSGDNKIVKAAAATFVGVPAGMFGEMKQVFVGVPPEERY